MATPATSAAPSVNARLATMPVNGIDIKDIKAAANGFDQWLQKRSNGYVTLERVEMIAGAVPVVGNIMAFVDVLNDVADMADAPQINFLHWVSLGINLIGVVPMPGTGAGRMALRPMLKSAKQAMGKMAKQTIKNSKGLLKDVIVTQLTAHVADTLLGEFSTFIETAIGKLNGMLNTIASYIQQMFGALANAIRQAAGSVNSLVNYKGSLGDAKKHMGNIGQRNAQLEKRLKAAYDGKETSASSLFSLAGDLIATPFKNAGDVIGAGVELEQAGAQYVASKALDDKALQAICNSLKAMADKIDKIAKDFKGQVAELANPGNVEGIMAILMAIKLAVDARKKHKAAKPGAAKESKVTETSKKQPVGHQDGVGQQAKAEKDAGPKNGTTCSTCNAITFAEGAEVLDHTDFTVAGPWPIEWTRVYRSNLKRFDQGPLGARWINGYTTRLELFPDDLVYQSADGRSHVYPLLAAGESHDDPIEMRTLHRLSDTQLVINNGKALVESYELVGNQFRLVMLSQPNGLTTGLRYDHAFDGQQRLSDILVRDGDTVLCHVGTRLNDTGQIASLWLLEAGTVVRQLAAYHHDQAGDLVAAQDENGNAWQYQYRNHLLTRYVDRTGRGMNLEWNGLDVDAKAIHEWADDGSYDTRLEWDDNIRLTTVTDALGNQTEHYYDILGFTYRIAYPDGSEEWLYRDDNKNVVQHLHPDGTADHYRYDERSNLLAHTRADGSTVHFAWNDDDRLVGIRDPEGNHWLRDYDELGNLTEEIDPLGNKTTYQYNSYGQPVEITDAKGGIKVLAYTAQGNLASYTDCSGKTSSWQYDEQGHLLKAINAAGETTEYHYQGGQLDQLGNPDGTTERFSYDAEGRLLSHTDPLGQSTRYSYTAAGLVNQRVDAAGQRIGYAWDALGRLTGLSNENGAQWRFSYDPVGRLLEETGFDNRRTQYHYDEGSGVLAHVDDNGLRNALQFDAMGRLQERAAGPLTALDSEGVPRNAQTETFAYGANGQLIHASNVDSGLQWFYDEVGNLKHEHQHYVLNGSSVSAVWRHEYDVLGNRIATVRPDGHRVDWLTYGSGHVHGLLLDQQETLGFERDELHREIKRQLGNQLTQTQQYDPAGRLKEQRLAYSDVAGQTRSGTVVQRQYQYDKTGQLTGINDSRRGALQYRYDPVGRLLEANSALGKETFAFDPAGNLLDEKTKDTRSYQAETGQSFNSQLTGGSKLLDNLLRDYAGVHYDYDSRGNLSTRIDNGKITQYEWDHFNRLSSVSTDEVLTKFAYDPLGRRLYKHSSAIRPFNANLQWAEQEQARITREKGLGITLFGWDGDTLAWESNAQRTTHYLFEPGSFVPLLQATSAGTIRLPRTPAWEGAYDIAQDPLWQDPAPAKPFEHLNYYHCDHLGTPQELTDQHGNLSWQAHYKAWGEAKEVISDAAKKAGIGNPFRFQGQYYDHETGLHYNRHRYYDPVIGRFVSKDPISLLGGMNIYQYAPNSTEWIDPLGLAKNMQPVNIHELRGLADQIHGVLPEGKGRNCKTTAVASAVDKNGNSVLLSASSGGNLSLAQRQKASSLGVQAVPGAQGIHAEAAIFAYAKGKGLKIQEYAASRPICDSCCTGGRDAKATAVSPLKTDNVPGVRTNKWQLPKHKVK